MVLNTRWLNSKIFPGGINGQHQVLTYHRVLPEQDPIFPNELTSDGFKNLLDYLSQNYRVLPLGEALVALQQGTLPPASISITFDDGYQDNYTEGYRLLREYNMQATFFIASAFLDGGRMWNDSIVETVRRLPTGENDLSDLGFGCPILNGPDDRRALVMKIIDGIKYKEPGIRQELVDKLSGKVQPIPSDSMMTSDHVRRIREEGMEVGGHTSTHPILTSLSDDEALLEIRKGKQELEEIIGENLQLFAYPNGKYLQDFDDRHMAMVRDSGFKFAVTTDSGVANRHSQGLRIPRYTPWRAAGPRFSIDLLLNSFRKTQP